MDRGTGTVLTIGHSNHTLEVFFALLARHRVSVLADVRSAPYSRFNLNPAVDGGLESPRPL